MTKYVGARIRDLRQYYGLSQATVAKALDVATHTISRWETATRRPTIDDLDELARLYGISIVEFFPKEGEERRRRK